MNTGIVRRRKAVTTGGLVQASFTMRPEMMDALDRLAEQRGMSRAAIIGELIDRGMAEIARDEQIEAIA